MVGTNRRHCREWEPGALLPSGHTDKTDQSAEGGHGGFILIFTLRYLQELKAQREIFRVTSEI